MQLLIAFHPQFLSVILMSCIAISASKAVVAVLTDPTISIICGAARALHVWLTGQFNMVLKTTESRRLGFQVEYLI